MCPKHTGENATFVALLHMGANCLDALAELVPAFSIIHIYSTLMSDKMA